jgi:hypothetical protein
MPLFCREIRRLASWAARLINSSIFRTETFQAEDEFTIDGASLQKGPCP